MDNSPPASNTGPPHSQLAKKLKTEKMIFFFSKIDFYILICTFIFKIDNFPENFDILLLVYASYGLQVKHRLENITQEDFQKKIAEIKKENQTIKQIVSNSINVNIKNSRVFRRQSG